MSFHPPEAAFRVPGYFAEHTPTDYGALWNIMNRSLSRGTSGDFAPPLFLAALDYIKNTIPR